MKLLNKIYKFISKYDPSNIYVSTKVFFNNINKKNTKYPDYLTDFEKKTAKYFNMKYAITFPNGTTACSVMLHAIGVKKNSKVLVSKLTFPSIISSILKTGGSPIFLDFDKNLQIKIEKNKVLEAKYIILTHAYGFPQRKEIIDKLLSINPSIIIAEDISHSQGSFCGEQLTGSIGIASFMSMQGDKSISAGEGGIMLCNSDQIYERAIFLSHLNRKVSSTKNKLNLISKIGFIGKARMNPLGAINALHDLNMLKKRNKKLINKLKIINDHLFEFGDIEFPRIDDYNSLGGFHYGIPFFCENKIILEKLSKYFLIVKYNWPFLDNDESFRDPEKFYELIYSEKIYELNVFDNANDLRDNLYFFDLNEIKFTFEYQIEQKLKKFKSDN